MMATEFPLIARNAGIVRNNLKQIYSEVCKVRIEEEQAYLDKAEEFIETECMNTIRRIQYKRQSIINTEKFDISKVSNLPYDCVYEISTYLQPEIEYTRKFILLSNFLQTFNTTWDIEYVWLTKVPKKLMMKLIHNCGICPSLDDITIRAKHPKSRWCSMIKQAVEAITPYAYYQTRLDKILAVIANQRYEIYSGASDIVNWYKFILYITVYNKYRRELEKSISGHSQSLANLKNNTIKVKR